jgi:hypothetical protein
MAYVLGEPTVQQYFDHNGDPLVNGSIEFYISGTTTPTPIYSDAGGTAAGVVISLNSNGAPQNDQGTPIPLFFNTSRTYKIVRKDANGTVIAPTIDPYSPKGAGSLVDQSFATMDELLDSSGNSGYETIYIASYNPVTYPSTSGPKGGHYRYRTAATGTPGTISGGYAYDQDGVGWLLSHEQKITPFIFGAVGDNTTDDAEAIQNSLDYCGQSGIKWCGGGGNYFVDTNTVNGNAAYGLMLKYSGMALDGEGCIIRRATTSTRKGITIASDVTGNPVAQLSDIEIFNLTLDGDNVNATGSGGFINESCHGIDIRNSRNVKIHHCNILRSTGDGIYVAYGSEDVDIHDCYIDSERFVYGSTKGYRMGVAILSGRNIRVHDCHITGFLDGIDIEIDNNQIASGYDYLENIQVSDCLISNMSSNAWNCSTTAATAVTTKNIKFVNSICKAIDETIISVDYVETAGFVRNLDISGVIGDESYTYKGVSLVRCEKVTLSNNTITGIKDIGLQIGNGCKNIVVNGGRYESNENDAIRVQESIATQRTPLVLDSVTAVANQDTALQIIGAYDLNVSGGSYIGGLDAGENAIGVSGSAVAGNDTRVIGVISGVAATARNSTGYAINVGANNYRTNIMNNSFVAHDSATYVAHIASSIVGKAFFSSNSMILAGVYLSEFAGIFDESGGGMLIANQLVAGAKTLYDPPTLASGSTATVSISAPGLNFGDHIESIAFAADLQGITLSAVITAADTVSVTFHNNTGGSINLPAANVSVLCSRLG